MIDCKENRHINHIIHDKRSSKIQFILNYNDNEIMNEMLLFANVHLFVIIQ